MRISRRNSVSSFIIAASRVRRVSTAPQSHRRTTTERVTRSFVPVYQYTTQSTDTPTTASRNTNMGFYDLKAELPDGKTYDFADLKGKVVLIVNVASKCGFTPQYNGLQKLYNKHKDRDFTILGFPCNQFGSQEPGDDADIAQFCQINHGVEFPLMKKSDVNGDSANEVYKWLKSQKSGLFGLTLIKWNFEKFLIDKEGNVVQRYSSAASPDTIDADVAKLL